MCDIMMGFLTDTGNNISRLKKTEKIKSLHSQANDDR